MNNQKILSTILLVLVLSGLLFGGFALAASGQAENPAQGVIVSKPVSPAISRAVRDIKPTTLDPLLNREEINPIRNPGLFLPDLGLSGSDTTKKDPLVALSQIHTGYTPTPIFTFEGLGTDGYTPPDTMGEVGPNHYVQMVNISFAVYDKSGNVLVADTPFTDLFSGSGLSECASQNDGDPVVLWDSLADRWLLSQFAVTTSPEHLCIAISTTNDPTGSYYLYQFQMPDFPDYFKFGVWPDAYYMGSNTGYPNQYYAYAFDRAAMLAGSPATYQYSNGHPNFLLPADLDGSTPPPANSPGYFYTMLAEGYANHPPGVDRIVLYEFDVDWNTPANSTFGMAKQIPISDYNYTTCGFFVGNCIPQPGTDQKLDAVDAWPMWRFAYRNLGSYEAMVGNFTVDTDGADHAGIRWFELQKTGAAAWNLHQEGTHSPDSDHRWMGSIAMDGSGNIALGYSVSSSTTYPSLRYATRLTTDLLGSLQAEATLYPGGGSQTGPYNRWGDYSSMSVDPTDECTFWYTGEYHDVSAVSSQWNTRIGTFRIPECTGKPGGLGILTGRVTDVVTSDSIQSALITSESASYTYQTQTNAMGYYTSTLPAGTYEVTATAYGYQPVSMVGVSVYSETITTLDFSLTPAEIYTVTGVVRDDVTNWPLYAQILISGNPVNPSVTSLWTDPVTGEYQISLAEGITYTFDVESWVPGYHPTSREIGPLSSNTSEDFYLEANSVTCNAPGYSLRVADGISETFDTASLPPGWTVVNNGGNCNWRFDDPGGRGNLTGGVGNFAIADSDHCGIGTKMDTYLYSPVVDLSGYSSVPFEFKYDYYNFSVTELAAVDFSADGGETWTNLVAWNSNQSGPATYSQDLTTLAGGTTEAKLRFHYLAPGWDWWWEVDDVLLGGVPTISVECVPPMGGLVVGHVFDENTSALLNGALIENELGDIVEAVATPLDDHVVDAFYTIYAPAGNRAFTATMSGGYTPEVENIIVGAGNTEALSFNLSAGWLEATPSELHVTLSLGEILTETFDLVNNGNYLTEFSIDETNGGPDVPWLATDPITGTVVSAVILEIEVTFNASVPEITQPGDYLATLNILNDTPYGQVSVPVRMTVLQMDKIYSPIIYK